MGRGFGKSGESLEKLLTELAKDKKRLMDDHALVVAPTDRRAGRQVDSRVRSRCYVSQVS